MIGLTGPVIATRYLDTTGQWEKVGVDKRETAIKYIRTGVLNTGFMLLIYITLSRPQTISLEH